MSNIIYWTKDGDVLDAICQKYYGITSGVVEQVLQVNPHLAELEAVFEAGIKITLPQITQTQETQSIKLWS